MSETLIYPIRWDDYKGLKALGHAVNQWQILPRVDSELPSRKNRSVFYDPAHDVFYAQEKHLVRYSPYPEDEDALNPGCEEALDAHAALHKYEMECLRSVGFLGLRGPQKTSFTSQAIYTVMGAEASYIQFECVTATSRVPGENLNNILKDKTRDQTMRAALAKEAALQSYVLAFAFGDGDRIPRNVLVDGNRFGHIDFEGTRASRMDTPREKEVALARMATYFFNGQSTIRKNDVIDRLIAADRMAQANQNAIGDTMTEIFRNNIADGIRYVYDSYLFAPIP